MGLFIHIDHNASLRRTKTLCREYLDTAGRFLGACSHVGRAIQDPMSLRPGMIFTRSTSDLWHDLGNHRVGSLTQCSLGHLYSMATFNECPECGKRVDIPSHRGTRKEFKDDTKPVQLQEDAFLVKMKEMAACIKLKEGTADLPHDASVQPIEERVSEALSTISSDGLFNNKTEHPVKSLQEDAFLTRMRDMGMCA